ncbi:aspartate/glutamate racemase family protein [Kribbella sp. DT2]|uniref:aspartate/glutamate racemase family protein n=1 Tax=Kribbella sp. DT2 TaxID=3393427 RepID=UPI003CEB0CF2
MVTSSDRSNGHSPTSRRWRTGWAGPGLHIAEVVAAEVAAAGYRTVGILGTRWTMESDLYPRAFADHGIAPRVPDEEARIMIQDLTFKELTNGVLTDDTRRRFTDVISDLADDGCDAVALVCTEFPLLLPPSSSPLPTLESTVLLANAAADLAMDDTGSLPVWRGGRAEAVTG